MWGYPAAVQELRRLCDRHGLALIEDCAEAICARLTDGGQVGSVGELGCFSFFSKKQLAVGEGGAVTTDDDDLAASVRSLRSHAMTSVTWERHRGHGLGYDITDVGFNYRIDEPRAALALSRFERLGDDIEARREVARAYRRHLSGVEGLEIPFDDEQVERSSHFAFPVLARDGETRDRVRSQLRERGVQTTFYPALHTLSEYRGPRRRGAFQRHRDRRAPPRPADPQPARCRAGRAGRRRAIAGARARVAAGLGVAANRVDPLLGQPVVGPGAVAERLQVGDAGIQRNSRVRDAPRPVASAPCPAIRRRR